MNILFVPVLGFRGDQLGIGNDGMAFPRFQSRRKRARIDGSEQEKRYTAVVQQIKTCTVKFTIM